MPRKLAVFISWLSRSCLFASARARHRDDSQLIQVVGTRWGETVTRGAALVRRRGVTEPARTFRGDSGVFACARPLVVVAIVPIHFPAPPSPLLPSFICRSSSKKQPCDFGFRRAARVSNFQRCIQQKQLKKAIAGFATRTKQRYYSWHPVVDETFQLFSSVTTSPIAHPIKKKCGFHFFPLHFETWRPPEHAISRGARKHCNTGAASLIWSVIFAVLRALSGH